MLQIWAGEAGHVEETRKAFYHRLKIDGAARSGAYSEEMEAA